MVDDVLKGYLPKYGDRLAVVSFAKCKVKKIDSEAFRDQKHSLLDKVKEKMNSHFTRSKAQQGNSHAKKMDRRVEIGWLDFAHSTKEYKQIYQKKGGGIKHETFSIDTPLSAILKQAKEWFFPDGQNRQGKISEFDIFITDSSQSEIDGHTTVGEMYEQSKVKMLRLYIASKKKILKEKIVDEKTIEEENVEGSSSRSQRKRQKRKDSDTGRMSPLPSMASSLPTKQCDLLHGESNAQLQMSVRHRNNLSDKPLLSDDALELVYPEMPNIEGFTDSCTEIVRTLDDNHIFKQMLRMASMNVYIVLFDGSLSGGL